MPIYIQDIHRVTNIVHGEQLPSKDKFNILIGEKVDDISNILYWVRVTKVAFSSKHPHLRAMEEGFAPNDIDIVRNNITLTSGITALAIASGAFISIISH